MKSKQVWLSVLFCFILASSTAQDFVHVAGKIFNQNMAPTIEIRINKSYLNGQMKKYTSPIGMDGSFSFTIELSEPVIGSLEYYRSRDFIFLQPGDTVKVEFIADDFPQSVVFSGKGGVDNTLLKRYYREMEIETNQFRLVQYKHGNMWYRLDPKLNVNMQISEPEPFTLFMTQRKEKAYSILEYYGEGYSSGMSTHFKNYMEAEIFYDWAYHMLLYANVYRNRHQISDEFLNFIQHVPLENSYMGNFYYRQFLSHFIIDKQLKSNDEIANYNQQYAIATKYTSGETLAFLRSDILSRAIRKKEFKNVQPAYEEFLEQNEYLDYSDKVVATFHEFSKYSIGSTAPSFEAVDREGYMVSKKSFEGLVVFLNFWASWCRPCLKKMHEIKLFQEELEKLGIVFVHVSFDRSKDTWTHTLDENNFPGFHLWAAEGINGTFAQSYDVQALPKYVVINKNGKFARTPDIRNLDELKEALLDLTKQSTN